MILMNLIAMLNYKYKSIFSIPKIKLQNLLLPF